MAENNQNVVPDYTNINIPDKLLQVVNGGKPIRSQSFVRQMLKVPPLLRQEKNNQQEYDPLVVSLGPYHHGKKELQLAEDFKIKALEMLVADSGMDIMFFYTKVFDVVNDARNCYIDGSTDQYDDPNFAQMMLLDACFVINYVVAGRNLRNLYVTRNCLGDLFYAYILRDLFLLENQIPFWLLKMLIGLGYGKENGEEMLDDFLNSIVFGEYKRSGIASSDVEQPFHLLDAFWLILVSDSLIDQSRQMMIPLDQPNKLGKFSKKCFNLLKNVTKFHCQWRKWGDDQDVEEEYSGKKFIHSFRSASELKARGIHFSPSSSGDSLKSIKFKTGNLFATLEVPIWFVSIYTKGFFLNMIAYELCLSNSTNCVVTAYIAFMKALIDNPKDVKELREKKILLTTLGNDEDVVKLYKELNTYGLDNVTIFHNVKEEIQAHYNNKAKTWLAELLYTYFRSPWTVITLLAATFLLLLTFLQTYFTINPWKG